MRKQKFIIALIILFLSHPVSAENLQKYFTLGQQAYHAGQYEKAVSYFEKVVELDTNFAPVYNALALAHNALNASIADITWLFNVAVEIDPQYLEAYNNMCRIFYQAQEFEKAESACLEVLRIQPGYGSAELSLAWIYLVGKNQPKEAIYYFDEVLKKVQNPMIIFGLGMAYAQNGDRALVLDTSMKLKSMGEQQLANQLENTLRTIVDTSSMLPPTGPIVMPQRQQGQVIGGPPVQAAAAPATPSDASGGMRIRLRGNLTNLNPQPAQAAAVQSSAGSSDVKGVFQSNRSAIERIRELQRMRQRGVTSQTYIPKGSGY